MFQVYYLTLKNFVDFDNLEIVQCNGQAHRGRVTFLSPPVMSILVLWKQVYMSCLTVHISSCPLQILVLRYLEVLSHYYFSHSVDAKCSLEVEHFQKVVDASVISIFAIKVCTEIVFSC